MTYKKAIFEKNYYCQLNRMQRPQLLAGIELETKIEHTHTMMTTWDALMVDFECCSELNRKAFWIFSFLITNIFRRTMKREGAML